MVTPRSTLSFVDYRPFAAGKLIGGPSEDAGEKGVDRGLAFLQRVLG
jgi:hypothetical protein